MKKLLLASVAAVAVTAFAAGAIADDASNNGLKLGLGGYYSVQGAYGWQSDKAGAPGQNVEKEGIFQYGEINFTAEKTFDNGLTVGYKGVMELPVSNGSTGETVPSTVIRQDYGYFSGNWGRFELGQNYSPLYYMSMDAPAVNDEFDSIDPDFNLVNVTPAAAGTVSGVANTLGGGNYATYGFTPFYHDQNALLGDKVVYYTPRFNGFQLGGSYAPSGHRTGDGTKSATGGFSPDNTFNEQDQRLEVAAGYDASWYGVGVKVSGGYGHAELGNNVTTGNVLDRQLKDEQAWIGGAQLSYLGWTLGGGYLWDNNGQSFHSGTLNANGESNVWDAGLGYDFGPYHAGVTYYDNETDVIHTAGVFNFKSDDKLKRWVVGGGYKVAPGVDLETTVQFDNYDTARSDLNPLGNNNATVFTLGTTVNF